MMSNPAGTTLINLGKTSPRHATVEDRDGLRISHQDDPVRYFPAPPDRDWPQAGAGAIPPRDGRNAAGHQAPRSEEDADHRWHGRGDPPPARRTVDPRLAFF